MKKIKKTVMSIVRDKLECARDMEERGYQLTPKGMDTLADTAVREILEMLDEISGIEK